MNRLYVGNLQWSVSESDLLSFFSVAGNVVSVTVITDRNTGKSRGFGFVEMSNDQEAEQAIALCNDKYIQGRKIMVNWAKPERNSQPSEPQKKNPLDNFLDTSNKGESLEFYFKDKGFSISRFS